MIEDGREIGILVVGAGFLGATGRRGRRDARAQSLWPSWIATNPPALRVAQRRCAAVERDFASAIGRVDVDAVVIATPHADHAAQALAALEAGKHVLVEKPLTIDPDSARASRCAPTSCGSVSPPD